MLPAAGDLDDAFADQGQAVKFQDTENIYPMAGETIQRSGGLSKLSWLLYTLQHQSATQSILLGST